jgi:4-hydroxybenzoate polyprenyltransferase
VTTDTNAFQRGLTGAAAPVWLTALRPMQWAKNLLMLLPLIAGHAVTDVARLAPLALAMLGMCLAASGTYLVNDVLDRKHDQTHPTKQYRPIAAGSLSPTPAVMLSGALMTGGLALAVSLGPWLGLGTLTYIVLTTAYSTHLKRQPIIDVLILASLFTLRVIIGGLAVAIFPSAWLLAFCMFLFLSLAVVKRYSELRRIELTQADHASGRGYRTSDLPLLKTVGLVAGYLAVVVLTLYINSPAVDELYAHPKLLLLVCPVLLYWVTRIWLLAHRDQLADDPFLFALTDRTSWLCLGCVLLISTAAALV